MDAATDRRLGGGPLQCPWRQQGDHRGGGLGRPRRRRRGAVPVKTHDYIHRYRGYWSDGGRCRIRIYHEDGRVPAATEIPFRSSRGPSGLSILRATEDLITLCASALVAPAEQRGTGCGDGHEDNSRHGAHLQPFSENDQAGEGRYGGIETHQDAEDASREFAQGFELQRVRDGRGEHRHAEAGEEELRIEQGAACACYPERKEDERPYAERDHKPRPTRESTPRAGGEEDVGGPQT